MSVVLSCSFGVYVVLVWVGLSSAVVHFDDVMLKLVLASTAFSWFGVCCVWCTFLLNFHYVGLFISIESSCL